jgi:hypothetical protein
MKKVTSDHFAIDRLFYSKLYWFSYMKWKLRKDVSRREIGRRDLDLKKKIIN